jgi:carbamoyl-phosphate synthase small subunit
MTKGEGMDPGQHSTRKAVLVLADGTVFEGETFGAEAEVSGEVVFNTSMTGYQEILTDPSYRGQIVVMTYPLIGNYGINSEDAESYRPYLSGLIVKEYCPRPSNWRATKPLDRYLKENAVAGLEGIDTRALARHLRDHGAQQGILSTTDEHRNDLVRKAGALPTLLGRDLVCEVTCQKSYNWNETIWPQQAGGSFQKEVGDRSNAPQHHVVVYDFGVKQNILRMLIHSGCRVTVVPASASAEETLNLKPDGILLSNGPGDPEAVSYAIREIKKLLGKKPIFGICLGHQLLGLAMGGKTYKLKFGHHGGNQPVMDLNTKKVEVTTHNHGFAVDVDSLGPEVELTHVNLNDQTVEGMRHRSLPIFSVQYHPEASPGPHDAHYLFNRFKEMMENA